MYADKAADYESADATTGSGSKLAATIDYKGNTYDGEAMNFSDILDNGYSIVIYRMALVE